MVIELSLKTSKTSVGRCSIKNDFPGVKDAVVQIKIIKYTFPQTKSGGIFILGASTIACKSITNINSSPVYLGKSLC